MMRDISKCKNKKVFIFDTETTGLPKRKSYYSKGTDEYPNPNITNKYDNARIVSIAWAYIDNFTFDNLTKVKIETCLIKPIDFYEIPNSDLHGVTYDQAITKGVVFKDMLKNGFLDHLNNCDFIIGHNVLFDVFIFASELYRNKFNKSALRLMSYIKDNKYVCTGEIGRMICQMPTKQKEEVYKMPKLQELYEKLGCDKQITFHHVYDDVYALIEILKKMISINKNINVISYNIFTSTKDKKYGETHDQINHIFDSNYDAMFLQECSSDLETKIDLNENVSKYLYLKTTSHCGYTYLVISKRLIPKVLGVFAVNGIILAKINTIYGIIIFGSVHLEPFGNKQSVEKRKQQVDQIEYWIKSNSYDIYPIIIGGDTNMRDHEDNNFSLLNDDTKNYHTYPNKTVKYDDVRKFVETMKYDFRFDRFLTLNATIIDLKIHESDESDHFAIIGNYKIEEYNIPTKNIDTFWLCDNNNQNMEKDNTCGKWILFYDRSDIDVNWISAKIWYNMGKLTDVTMIKSGTLKSDSKEIPIIFYCEKSDNEEYVMKIGKIIIECMNYDYKKIIYYHPNKSIDKKKYMYKLETKNILDNNHILADQMIKHLLAKDTLMNAIYDKIQTKIKFDKLLKTICETDKDEYIESFKEFDMHYFEYFNMDRLFLICENM